jgi:hypothetical protein
MYRVSSYILPIPKRKIIVCTTRCISKILDILDKKDLSRLRYEKRVTATRLNIKYDEDSKKLALPNVTK